MTRTEVKLVATDDVISQFTLSQLTAFGLQAELCHPGVIRQEIGRQERDAEGVNDLPLSPSQPPVSLLNTASSEDKRSQILILSFRFSNSESFTSEALGLSQELLERDIPFIAIGSVQDLTA